MKPRPGERDGQRPPRDPVRRVHSAGRPRVGGPATTVEARDPRGREPPPVRRGSWRQRRKGLGPGPVGLSVRKGGDRGLPWLTGRVCPSAAAGREPGVGRTGPGGPGRPVCAAGYAWRGCGWEVSRGPEPKGHGPGGPSGPPQSRRWPGTRGGRAGVYVSAGGPSPGPTVPALSRVGARLVSDRPAGLSACPTGAGPPRPRRRRVQGGGGRPGSAGESRARESARLRRRSANGLPRRPRAPPSERRAAVQRRRVPPSPLRPSPARPPSPLAARPPPPEVARPPPPTPPPAPPPRGPGRGRGGRRSTARGAGNPSAPPAPPRDLLPPARPWAGPAWGGRTAGPRPPGQPRAWSRGQTQDIYPFDSGLSRAPAPAPAPEPKLRAPAVIGRDSGAPRPPPRWPARGFWPTAPGAEPAEGGPITDRHTTGTRSMKRVGGSPEKRLCYRDVGLPSTLYSTTNLRDPSQSQEPGGTPLGKLLMRDSGTTRSMLRVRVRRSGWSVQPMC